jgi:DNA-binding transcriptional LysR family regulator
MNERRVTRAGQHIGLSQRAVSHALGRLLHMLKDELFILVPDGMVLTLRAEAVAHPLRNPLGEMQLALDPGAFDPAAADRRFALALPSSVVFVVRLSPSPRRLTRELLEDGCEMRLALESDRQRDIN